ncbi:hypothetical protein AGMMS49975_06530 [Clostridia bacterium]|nr:hypothetical protein AGMMS49975_06530 [Clostridia bacterium]GHU73765.1 hypothetical protein FACS1894188_00130 [Clostridia bacterium]
MRIGKKLKYLRLGQNKTQKDISDFLNMTANGYQKYELSTREPSLYMLSKLAAYYDVSYDFLFSAGVFKNWEEVEKHWAAIMNAVLAEYPKLSSIMDLPKIEIGNVLNNFIREIIIDDINRGIKIIFKE